MEETSMWNDIVSYLATHPDSVSLSSVDTAAATSRSAAFYSPAFQCAELINEAKRSVWAPTQNGLSNAAERDGCSDEGCVHLPVLDHQSKHCRYKTELCRPFEESGFCKYGSRCQFAHGRQELKTVDRHPKYKTQLCKTFHTTGLCRYGSRCHFIHNEDEGAQRHTLSPHQQLQQQSMPGLRKLTGRQMSKSTEEQRHVTSATLPTSVTFSATRHVHELFPRSGLSLPSSAANSPSNSPAFFSDDSFSSSAAAEIFSQTSFLRQVPISPFSESFHTTDLLTLPPILPSTPADSASVHPKFSRRDVDWTRKDSVDFLLRHLTKAQIEVLVEYLLHKENGNTVV